MQTLYDLVNSVIFADDVLSLVIKAPPSQGKSFTLGKAVEVVDSWYRATQITSAGFRELVSRREDISHIVISDVASIINQKIDHSVFRFMLESTEEGVASFVLSSLDDFREVKRKIGFVMAMVPEDMDRLVNKIKKSVDPKALFSRFIIFSYSRTTSKSSVSMTLTGEMPPFVLKYPSRVIYSSKRLLERIIDISYNIIAKHERKAIIRIIRNHFHLAKAYASINDLDIDDHRIYRFILAVMLSRYNMLSIENMDRFIAGEDEFIEVAYNRKYRIGDDYKVVRESFVTI